MAFRTILVIGKNHEEIVKKYSLDTKVEPYVKMKLDDASRIRQEHMTLIEKILSNKEITLTNAQKEIYKNYYLDLKEMDAFEYYCTMTKGCYYDEENGDAYTEVNPNAYYQYERCPQRSLELSGEESAFSNPFKLVNGTISYSATKDEIDWSKMHLYNTDLYKRVYEMVVLDSEPQNEQEEKIKNNMKNRISYFDNFKDCDEYVSHSCSFWTYGVATEEKYVEVDYTISDKEWVSTFFDTYVKDLDGNEVLTIYEVKTID